MTNMEWIEKIAVEGGVHYGDTVNANPEKYRVAQTEEIRNQRKCEKCGEFFTPKTLCDGSLSRKNKYPKCIEERRAEIESEKKRKSAKNRKIYVRECSRCGAKVETTQAPRSRVPIYCKTCRKTIKKDERQTTYREPVAV